MLSPRTRALGRKDRSPFSSPNSNLLASPIAARRSSLEERRRPAAKFGDGTSPGPLASEAVEEEEEFEEGPNQQDIQDGNEGEDDEDDHGELSPLLPIFSAAHLGTGTLTGSHWHLVDFAYRFAPRL